MAARCCFTAAPTPDARGCRPPRAAARSRASPGPEPHTTTGTAPRPRARTPPASARWRSRPRRTPGTLDGHRTRVHDHLRQCDGHRPGAGRRPVTAGTKASLIPGAAVAASREAGFSRMAACVDARDRLENAAERTEALTLGAARPAFATSTAGTHAEVEARPACRRRLTWCGPSGTMRSAAAGDVAVRSCSTARAKGPASRRRSSRRPSAFVFEARMRTRSCPARASA